MVSRDLPVDRLATADSTGRRIYLYPSDVKGFWRNRRVWTRALLMNFFLLLPWIRIHGQPALLLDIVHRKFSILGVLFWAHDAPLLVLVAGVAILALTWVTAVWGRVWCGWACPQTVFTEGVFRRFERWIEGDAVERRRLDDGPLSFTKLWKKTAKWGIFTILALLISHSFLALFTGTEALARMIRTSPAENPGFFLFAMVVTGGILFDFGWFREQFCTVVCPYGRFQSVLMDASSQVIAYDAARGEPRREGGDCVNCYRCVQVCPTGIDIRRGLQLECIACTSCIDACDDVMRRLKKPEGLISYQRPKDGVRPRVIVSAALLLASLIGLVVAVSQRQPLMMTAVRGTGESFQTITDTTGQELINHFHLDLRNQTGAAMRVKVSLPESEVAAGLTLALGGESDELLPGESYRAELFVTAPRAAVKGRRRVPVQASWTDSRGENREQSTEVILLGPWN